jgi:hypothetical protein
MHLAKISPRVVVNSRERHRSCVREQPPSSLSLLTVLVFPSFSLKRTSQALCRTTPRETTDDGRQTTDDTRPSCISYCYSSLLPTAYCQKQTRKHTQHTLHTQHTQHTTHNTHNTRKHTPHSKHTTHATHANTLEHATHAPS